VPREFPLKNAPLIRRLKAVMPMIKWEDVTGTTFVVVGNGDMAGLEWRLRKSVTALASRDWQCYLEEWRVFVGVRKVTITAAQAACIPPGSTHPRVERLKLVCPDKATAAGDYNGLLLPFTGLKALHLVVKPEERGGMLPLCGPGFRAPSDFRLTLSTDVSECERRANVFLTSQLLSMPFSWDANFFSNVVRLQMSELNEEFHIGALEAFMKVIRELPHLRRLGTLSSKAACLFDPARSDCRLEELVLTSELEEHVCDLFKVFLPLEREKKRCSLRSVRIHLQCAEGAVCQLKEPVERCILAGWHGITNTLCEVLLASGDMLGHHVSGWLVGLQRGGSPAAGDGAHSAPLVQPETLQFGLRLLRGWAGALLYPAWSSIAILWS
jgi:hypothetical protein